MNAPLRRRHQLAFAVLAVLLPAGFVLALLGRSGDAYSADLPADPRAAGTLEPLVPGAGRTLELRGEDAAWIARVDADRVALSQARGVARPDLHAYWSGQLVVDELPADARLLGAVSRAERTFALPAMQGTLVLFSLAHGEVVAHGSLAEAR